MAYATVNWCQAREQPGSSGICKCPSAGSRTSTLQALPGTLRFWSFFSTRWARARAGGLAWACSPHWWRSQGMRHHDQAKAPKPRHGATAPALRPCSWQRFCTCCSLDGGCSNRHALLCTRARPRCTWRTTRLVSRTTRSCRSPSPCPRQRCWRPHSRQPPPMVVVVSSTDSVSLRCGGGGGGSTCSAQGCSSGDRCISGAAMAYWLDSGTRLSAKPRSQK